MEIKDFTVLNSNGVNYYALKDVCSYLHMTQKLFEEEYGNVYRLYGSKWITVEYFNDIANVITKVVFNTYHKQLANEQGMSDFMKLLLVKDERTEQAFKQIVKQQPQKVMEKMISLEDKNVSNLLQKASKQIDDVKNEIESFKRIGYDVEPLCYYNERRDRFDWYLIGNGVFVEVHDYGYNYFYYDETTDINEDGDWHDVKYEHKLVKWNDEDYTEFRPLDIDFTGCNLSQCIIKCIENKAFIDSCNFVGTDDTYFEHYDIARLLLGFTELKRVDID